MKISIIGVTGFVGSLIRNLSRISLEDYAAAMLDELENLQHHRKRFSVAY